MTGQLKNPEYWRTRAEEVRLIGEDLQDPGSNAIMQRIADDYERLAKFTEERRVLLSEQ